MHDPIVTNVRRHSGIAGQFSITADVDYPQDDRGPMPVEFVGSVYGGPIVMRFQATTRVVEQFVSHDVTDRIGSQLSPEWVRAFFAPRV